eukprot:3497264-Amphidinium_carterae.1
MRGGGAEEHRSRCDHSHDNQSYACQFTGEGVCLDCSHLSSTRLECTAMAKKTNRENMRDGWRCFAVQKRSYVDVLQGTYHKSMKDSQTQKDTRAHRRVNCN